MPLRPLRPRRLPARDGSEYPPESSRPNPAYSSRAQSGPSYPPQGLTDEHTWHSLDHIDAQAHNTLRPILPTNEDLPFDSGSKKPVKHQRIEFSFADLSWEQGGFHRQYPWATLTHANTKASKVAPLRHSNMGHIATHLLEGVHRQHTVSALILKHTKATEVRILRQCKIA